jgi:AbiV family abortive infection protein
MAGFSEDWWAGVDAAVSIGEQSFASSDEFNVACEHVVRLLKDACLLFQAGSHARAAFMAVTAIEEIAKAHIGSFRRSREPVARGKDPLFRHSAKHALALGPTVAMGSRLQAVIGEHRMRELLNAAHAEGLVRLRESALYVSHITGRPIAPAQAVPLQLARESILLAIEAFDDGLVGYTERSMILGNETDELFAELSRT